MQKNTFIFHLKHIQIEDLLFSFKINFIKIMLPSKENIFNFPVIRLSD